MKLSGQQFSQIQEALLSAFSSSADLGMMVRLELDVNLEEIASGQNLRVVVFKLLTWAEDNGRILDLINGALNQRPSNLDLQRLQKDAQSWSALSESMPPPAVDSTEGVRPAEIDIFLSYSRHNTDVMRRLYADLRDAGFSVWTDEGLEAGTESWKAAVEEAVQQARCMVVILTPESKASFWVNNEVSYARQFERRIFPVLASGDVTSAVPIDLINAQRVDVRQDYKRNVDEKLIAVLVNYLRPSKEPAPPTPPPSPPRIVYILGGAVAILLLLLLIILWDLASRGELPPPWRPRFTPTSVALIPVVASTPTPGEETGTIQSSSMATESPEIESTSTVSASPTLDGSSALCLYIIEVLDLDTGTVIEGASVEIVYEGDQVLVGYTDSQGIFRPRLPCEDFELHVIRIRADGYVPYIEGDSGRLVRSRRIMLKPLNSARPPTGAADGDVWINRVDGAEYVYVSAGEFLMGSVPDVDSLADQDDEFDQHSVPVDGFWIMRTEVTNAQYQRFIEAGGYDERRYWTDAGWTWRQENDVTQPSCWEYERYDQPDQPVVCVSWYEAVAYTRWLAEETGQDVRLPTEAEWEKACRGTEGQIYPWSGQWDGSRLNYCDVNCPNDSKDEEVDDGYQYTAPVGSYPDGASPYGVLDMAGNVWEWTSSKYAAYPYDPDDGREKPEGDENRTLRGGSFWNTGNGVRCANRAHWDPDYRYVIPGFRVVAVSPGP